MFIFIILFNNFIQNFFRIISYFLFIFHFCPHLIISFGQLIDKGMFQSLFWRHSFPKDKNTFLSEESLMKFYENYKIIWYFMTSNLKNKEFFNYFILFDPWIFFHWHCCTEITELYGFCIVYRKDINRFYWWNYLFKTEKFWKITISMYDLILL